MATYSLEIREHAERQMQRIPSNVLKRILPRLIALQSDPRPRGTRKLMGREGWRIRVGEYRVIYEIDDQKKIVRVAAVVPRQSAYD